MNSLLPSVTDTGLSRSAPAAAVWVFTDADESCLLVELKVSIRVGAWCQRLVCFYSVDKAPVYTQSARSRDSRETRQGFGLPEKTATMPLDSSAPHQGNTALRMESYRVRILDGLKRMIKALLAFSRLFHAADISVNPSSRRRLPSSPTVTITVPPPALFKDFDADSMASVQVGALDFELLQWMLAGRVSRDGSFRFRPELTEGDYWVVAVLGEFTGLA